MVGKRPSAEAPGPSTAAKAALLARLASWRLRCADSQGSARLDLQTTLKAVGCLQLLYVAWALVAGGVWGGDSDGCPELFERAEQPQAYWGYVAVYTLVGAGMLVGSTFAG